MEEVLKEVKIALSIPEEDTLQDGQLKGIIKRIAGAMCLYLAEKEVPSDLSWVLVEASIARAGILGSEAYQSESIEGQSITYKTDPLEDYYSYLDNWAIQNKQKGLNSNKVRFF